jgi:hypothetical protein
MEVTEKAGFSAHKLRFISVCCLYLNVISLEDIPDESGMRVDSKD